MSTDGIELTVNLAGGLQLPVRIGGSLDRAPVTQTEMAEQVAAELGISPVKPMNAEEVARFHEAFEAELKRRLGADYDRLGVRLLPPGRYLPEGILKARYGLPPVTGGDVVSFPIPGPVIDTGDADQWTAETVHRVKVTHHATGKSAEGVTEDEAFGKLIRELIGSGDITINAGRVALGLEPFPDYIGAYARHGVITAEEEDELRATPPPGEGSDAT